MADPPWGIHMELPYSTISDDDMRRMDIPCLQNDGVTVGNQLDGTYLVDAEAVECYLRRYPIDKKGDAS
ncbi:n6 adenosine methyltransferase 70 kDa [Echinococcus multilocularis]|uniref:N6 adenosine methyltransferase 70 kDa n=1 Tax=Echinococcus multilocularis TaxID=6211 RepID=A0A0S4MMR6_ECHMU|nr:n6 adenosine methyltransferase 70 kDa [Echinococcus multilocularis]